jgi:hypothetical protein
MNINSVLIKQPDGKISREFHFHFRRPFPFSTDAAAEDGKRFSYGNL